MRGVWGVLVVSVAILGTTFFGSTIAAMTPETVTYTDYEYVTDITGLFESENVPVYTDYSPAANWNGFRTANNDYTSGIRFDSTQRYNGVPVIQEDGLTSHAIILSQLGLSNNIPPDSAGGITRWRITYDGMQVDNPNVVSISRIYTAIQDRFTQNDTSHIRIDCTGIWCIYDNKWTVIQSPNVYGYNVANPAYVDYYPNSDLCKVYNAAGTLLYAGSGINNSCALAWGGTGDALQNTCTMYEVALDNPEYIDIRNGLRLTQTDVSWTNGYLLNGMDVIIRPQLGETLEWQGNFRTDTGAAAGSWRVEVNCNYAGTTIYSYSMNNFGNITSYDRLNVGNWSTLLLSADTDAGELTITGVTNFTSFIDYKATDQTWTLNLPKGSFRQVQWFTDGGYTTKFGVVSTSAFLNNYSQAFVNPSIEIEDYFPDSPDYRITFDSFALFGESITINGTTYAVTGNQVDAAWDYQGTVERGPVDLSGLSVATDGTETIIKWSNGKTLTQNTTNRTISLGGLWYYNADYYEGEEKQRQDYSWEPLRWGLTEVETVAVYLGFLVLATFVCSRLKNMTWIDYAAVAVAAIAGWMML